MNHQPTEKDKVGSSEITEADCKAALDIFGKMLIEARDRAVSQWDQILDDQRKYPAWERLRSKFPDLDERARQVLSAALPHAIDTFMYCLLDALQASEKVRASVTLESGVAIDVAQASSGFAAEPTTSQGWLARFSRQRFEQPG